MTVEWLNEERTKARLTKGIFRKLAAVVHRHRDGQWYYENQQWVEKYRGCVYPKIEYLRDAAIEADKAAKKAAAWVPVAKAKLPVARVVK